MKITRSYKVYTIKNNLKDIKSIINYQILNNAGGIYFILNYIYNTGTSKKRVNLDIRIRGSKAK